MDENYIQFPIFIEGVGTQNGQGDSGLLNKKELIQFIWGNVEQYEDNLIQLIHNLRKKLNMMSTYAFISCERGKGYIFDKENNISLKLLDKKIYLIDVENRQEHSDIYSEIQK